MDNIIIEGDPTITLVKGDSRTIPVLFEDEEGNVIPYKPGDTIYFTVRANPKVLIADIALTITEFVNNVAYIEIFPEHTKNMRCKTYVYDIQYTGVDGVITTIVPASKFILIDEVTHV